MQTRTLRLSLAVALSTLIPYFAPVASAQYHGKFYGSYQISNVSESGEKIQLTLKVTLHNSSGRDVVDSGIVLFNEAPVASAIGAFSGISSLPASGKVTVSQEFTVSQVEYARWKQGLQPSLKLLLSNGNGSSTLERIELSPAPSPAVESE